MMRILANESPKRKQVYVLIGNEPFDACQERAQKVIEWGGEPYVQPLLPLNALRRHDFKVAHDWTERKLRDMQRYYNRHLWRYVPFVEYERAYRSSDHKAPELVKAENCWVTSTQNKMPAAERVERRPQPAGE